MQRHRLRARAEKEEALRLSAADRDRVFAYRFDGYWRLEMELLDVAAALEEPLQSPAGPARVGIDATRGSGESPPGRSFGNRHGTPAGQ